MTTVTVGPAEVAAVLGAGAFLFTGMAVGVWKYRAMMRSADHMAPPYVDIAHRAALLYAAACLVLGGLATLSDWPPAVDLAAVLVNEAFFASAVFTYVHLALRGRRETQFAHRTFTTTWGMAALITGELGGTAVLLAGAAHRLL